MSTRKTQSSIRADPFVDLSDRLCPECRGLGWMQTGRGCERCVVCDGSGWRQNDGEVIEWLRAKLAEWRAKHEA